VVSDLNRRAMSLSLGECSTRVGERAIAYTLDVGNLERSRPVRVSQTRT